eukprot:2267454-Rhodomonas_salina.1
MRRGSTSTRASASSAWCHITQLSAHRLTQLSARRLTQLSTHRLTQLSTRLSVSRAPDSVRIKWYGMPPTQYTIPTQYASCQDHGTD